jgi:branched-chain amino acid transport system substrate-binding protein
LGDEALGVITALHYNPWLDTQINKEFVQKFKNKYGKIPSYFAENCYTGMKWIDEAMTSLKGEVENPEKVLKALQSVRLKETPRGPISVDAFGNPVQNVYIMKVERVGGELQNKVIHTYPRVSQFWKYEPQDYLKLPLYSRDYPPLKP